MDRHGDDRPFSQQAPEKLPARPEQDQSPYSDAYYRSAPQEGRTPYGYNPAHYYAQEDTAAHQGQIGLRALLILSIFCVLVSGCLAVGGMYLLFHNREADPRDAGAAATLYAQARQAQEEEADMPLQPAPIAPGAVPVTGEDIYLAACSQVVGVTTSGRSFGRPVVGSGSGLIVSADGYILTNYHVIETGLASGRPIAVVTFDGTTYEAQVVGTEQDSDLAVLKIDAVGLEAAALGDSDQLAVGGSVWAVGNPLGDLPYTMTSGIVSALDRRIAVEDNVTVRMFQFDAAVNSGNSGGPVYNAYGQVVGIVTAKTRASGVEGLGFAIPICDACDIANDLITKGYVSGKAYLGLRLGSVTPAVARYFHMNSGAYIYSVEPGSAAEAAGLQAYDIITAADGQPINNADDMIAAIHSHKAGDTARLTIYRGPDRIEVSVTFGEAVPAATPEVSS